MGLSGGSKARGAGTGDTQGCNAHLPPSHRYFVWTLVGRLRGPGGREDPHSWPLLAYLLTCCIYPLASSCAHTFSTMSTRTRHICYFFDYAALSMYSLGRDGHVCGGFGGVPGPSTSLRQRELKHREASGMGLNPGCSDGSYPLDKQSWWLLACSFHSSSSSSLQRGAWEGQ